MDSPTVLHQLSYLVGKKLNCSITDTAGNTPLHYFASVPAQIQTGAKTAKAKTAAAGPKHRITVAEYKQCVELIVKAGADPLKKNELGKDALAVALEQGNLLLFEHLYTAYGRRSNKRLTFRKYRTNLRKFLVLTCRSVILCVLGSVHDLLEITDAISKRNILHQLVQLPFSVYQNRNNWQNDCGPAPGQCNILPLLEQIIKSDKDAVRGWLQEFDKFGQTPTLLACNEYCKMQLSSSYTPEDHSKVKREAELVLNIVGDVLKQFNSVLPRCILDQTRKAEEPSEKPEEASERRNAWGSPKKRPRSAADQPGAQGEDVQGISCLQFALNGNVIAQSKAKSWTINGVEYSTSKKLLINLIGMAKNDAMLEQLLMLENGKQETGLLYALNQGLRDEALLLVHESDAAGCASSAHSAVIRTTIDAQGKGGS